VRIAFIADWRSSLARQWVEQVVALGHEVLVLSSQRLAIGEAGAVGIRLEELPLALGSFRSAPGDAETSSGGGRRFAQVQEHLLSHVAAWDLDRHTAQAERLLDAFRPDVVHALRIPFEGMFAGLLRLTCPLSLSIWGNDFFILGPASRRNARLTRRAVSRARGLHFDCYRDLEESRRWALPTDAVTLIAPTNGGATIRMPSRADVAAFRARHDLPGRETSVLNPRGWRRYVLTREYLDAVRTVAGDRPDAHFVLADIAGNHEVEGFVRQAGLERRVSLLPRLAAADMPLLFSAASISVSPAVIDGTPNTLLEAMAAGCLPLAGDITSVREWITHGENGLLFDPRSPAAIAASITEALDDRELRVKAASINRELVIARAERTACLPRIDQFYRNVCNA
jgi:glycosyltransferase involved in cell wall biosynthesis